jgi:GDPmannose 4,6-dehydratase
MAAPRTDVLWRISRDLEEAGFDLSFTNIEWVYHSGFPKATDISKSLDKRKGRIGYDLSNIKNQLKDHYKQSGKTFAKIDEECGFHPASPYAISKVGTDLIGRYYAEAFNMCVMTTRMFTHTGPRRGDVFSESTFAKQIAMIEAGMQEPKIYVGNLESLRTYADVRDAVRAYYMLVTINPIGGEYYNIGGTNTCKIADMLDYLLSKSTTQNIEVVTDISRLRPIDADLQIPNTNKFKSHTGWEVEIPFEKTMDDLLEYWRNKIKLGRKFLNR